MTQKPDPISRKFVPIQHNVLPSYSESDGHRFRIISYNILAQAYVKSSYFPHSPAPCLKWKARSQAILTVLKSFEADFLCLQEVDEYKDFYKKEMENLGYASIYVQRSGRKRDGCGIFYKLNRAELVLQETIDYNDLVDSVEGGKEESSVSKNRDSQQDHGDPNDPRIRLRRNCVGIMALFRLKNSSSQHIAIANTHLYWDPEWVDVKIAQARCLLSRLASFRKLVSEKFDCSPPIILAGDFNSVPGDQVYNLLISDSDDPEANDQRVALLSVYGCTRGEPEFTNCTPGFTGTLDYIFYSGHGDVKPFSFLELPDAESPDVAGGLPNYFHPSDHLPIGAEFLVES